ncbi:hypothetical protein BC332_02151 [Capsicum chinense]|nr:hypothetical protein BC332_02151 [Capsicum chinense]
MTSMKTMMNMSNYCLNIQFIKSMKAVEALGELSFLCMNKTGVPYGDTLGLMNPLSKRSFNFSFNSLSSAGVILYGEIDTG